MEYSKQRYLSKRMQVSKTNRVDISRYVHKFYRIIVFSETLNAYHEIRDQTKGGITHVTSCKPPCQYHIYTIVGSRSNIITEKKFGETESLIIFWIILVV